MCCWCRWLIVSLQRFLLAAMRESYSFDFRSRESSVGDTAWSSFSIKCCSELSRGRFSIPSIIIHTFYYISMKWVVIVFWYESLCLIWSHGRLSRRWSGCKILSLETDPSNTFLQAPNSSRGNTVTAIVSKQHIIYGVFRRSIFSSKRTKHEPHGAYSISTA